MSKVLLQGTDAIMKLGEGCKKLTSMVSSTLGPKGRNVIIERAYSSALVTNDGVTIAREITLPDKIENIGASILKEASIKTNDLAGDGTTTACVLAESVISSGLKYYISGANPILLRRGMNKACKCIVDHLKEMSVNVKDSKDIYKVASISAQDENVGKLISNAFDIIGPQGVITLEDSNTDETTLRIIEGMEYDKGYLSSYMCNNMEKMEANYPNCDIYITENKITNIKEILPVLEYATQSSSPLLIICDDIDSEPLATIVLNKMRGNLSIVVTRAPAFADRRQAYMEDISVLCGATLISSRFANTSDAFDPKILGHASVRVTQNSTLITHGAGNSEDISQRISQIKTQIENASEDFEKEKLRQRLAKLTGGIAQILVGAHTEVEQKELKLRIEDAISATKAALAEGIIPGGGTALSRCIAPCKELLDTLDGDEKLGACVILDSLSAPLRTICANAGVSGDVVLNNILASADPSYGYDAMSDTYGNMFTLGIIDPTMVTRTAIENAISVASTMLSTSGIVADESATQSNKQS